MSGPDPHISSVYGTGETDLTKVASPQFDLYDLALFDITGGQDPGDLTKIAGEVNELAGIYEEADQTGRAMAHIRITEMEKAAAEGDPSDLQAFFADIAEPDYSEGGDLRSAVQAEIQRRLGR